MCFKMVFNVLTLGAFGHYRVFRVNSCVACVACMHINICTCT